ncbi:MAG: hypothetical protein HYY50_00885 [Candidatus Kerfeldbacteria bacterium]|nr:hypothetical protein [Candidatus Kerfeldbacteria bacterium]
MTKKQAAIRLLTADTYLAVLKNSAGSKIWRSAYGLADDRRQNLVRRGELSCAFYVSSILRLFNLLRGVHLTVAGTVADMKRSGWRHLPSSPRQRGLRRGNGRRPRGGARPRPGWVIRWASQKFADGEEHQHLGFYLGRGRAISNRSSTGVPTLHHWTFGTRRGKPVRPIIGLYWHARLDQA